jgi:hypothetical protein
MMTQPVTCEMIAIHAHVPTRYANPVMPISQKALIAEKSSLIPANELRSPPLAIM